MTSLSTEGGKAIRLIIFIVIFALYGYASRDENIFTGAIGAGAGYLFSNLFNHIVSIFPYFMLSLLAGSFAVAGIGVSYNRRLVKNTARRMFYLFFSIIIIASFFQGMFYLFFTMIFVTVLFHHITK
jgi:sensor histidine kinase YesM